MFDAVKAAIEKTTANEATIVNVVAEEAATAMGAENPSLAYAIHDSCLICFPQWC